ncbi:ABC transporter substrate-binding protein [Patulibacter brassicae]|uniref:ABC transporter substrate-binding protein n=1 Tax=Patulibacter brassicae TaxID=1705717 RepID=A0ABU4VP39_9ACTN|nr:ABC transporter substrate-binding protein [Patulibacter brassicae]MDX8152701.1 ABC transporter substrate-binding protein [Patulibacter brassicae]
MGRTPLRAFTAFAAVCALSVAGCGGSDDDNAGSGGSGASSNGELSATVGVIGPKTGPAPQFYETNTVGAQLAAADAEKQYGVKIKLVNADDQGTPEGASRAVQEQLNGGNVDALLASPQSGQALQTADVLQRSRIPWFINAQSPQIINYKIKPNWAFRTAYNSSELSDVLGPFVFSGNAKVGLVHSADGFGQSEAEALQATAKKQGKTLAAVEPLQPGASDYTAAVRRLKQAGVTRVYMSITSGSDTATVTKAMVQEDFEPDFKITNATILADFGELARPAQWKNLVFIDPRDLVDGAAKSLNADFKAKTGKEPPLPTNVYTSYMAINAYAQAVKAAGSTDKAAVRDALEKLPSIDVRGDKIANPFTADSHDAYHAATPKDWFIFGFDDKGEITKRGTVAEEIESGS